MHSQFQISLVNAMFDLQYKKSFSFLWALFRNYRILLDTLNGKIVRVMEDPYRKLKNQDFSSSDRK